MGRPAARVHSARIASNLLLMIRRRVAEILDGELSNRHTCRQCQKGIAPTPCAIYAWGLQPPSPPDGMVPLAQNFYIFPVRRAVMCSRQVVFVACTTPSETNTSCSITQGSCFKL